MNHRDGLGREPFWYKDAVIYEAHVRAFFDSNADGIGDFQGFTQKLDYLQELGVTAIWLLPFYPSPLKDDGYDIADYTSINPIYGTLRDFKNLLNEAHRRHLRVITELVLNHTSDQHPWFQRSRRAKPGSAWRDFYVWSDTPDKYKEARIIFHDFENSNWTWDPVAQAYYWHRFYSHQPDLNFDNPQVHKKIIRVLEFWLDLGVDGFRLDAIPYLYEREGTSCENLPECHQFLKTLRQHIDTKYQDRMLLAEANQWPEDAVAYFGTDQGDECHMAFHFPLMPRLFMSVRMEDRMPLVDILEQTPPIPENSHWALFLRNHDELTLEMVTDEERDYMYRVYANDSKARINLGIRRRLAPLLGMDRKRIELLHLLLFSLPGTPVLYYGDEIGMGDNVFLGDRNGVRTPMQWNSDKNAGFSRASPQALYLPIILDPEFHYETINVETQQRNPHSLWWWMKRVLALRKRFLALGRGTFEFLRPENRKILAFLRRYENETILVVANLSRFTQPVNLDLSRFRQTVPVELFGHTHFPAVTDQPYFLTLGPHAALWFSLEPASVAQSRNRTGLSVQTIEVAEEWQSVLRGNRRARFENCLAEAMSALPWFPAAERPIKQVQIRDAIPMPPPETAVLLVLGVDYREGDPEEFLLPVNYAGGQEAAQLERESPHLVLARLRTKPQSNEGLLYDASGSQAFCSALYEAIARKRSCCGEVGELVAMNLGLRRNGGRQGVADAPSQSQNVAPGARANAAQPAEVADQASATGKPRNGNGTATLDLDIHQYENKTTITFGQRYRLKLQRRLEAGLNPELELGRFLTERSFRNTLAVAGSLHYRRPGKEETVLGILSEFCPNAKNAWPYTLDALSRYFERVGSAGAGTQPDLLPDKSLLSLAGIEPSHSVVTMVGTYLESARLLGQRAGELHLALAGETEDRNFAPEPFTPFYQRALYQSMRNLAVENLRSLRLYRDKLPVSLVPQAELVAGLEAQIVARLRPVYLTRISARRIRCHGDFHLGRVLFTGKDFIIIDFETHQRRSLGERRLKRPVFQDVAGMIRSFDYAVQAALEKQLELGALHESNLASVEPWGELWFRWVSAGFVRAYLKALGGSNLLPELIQQQEVLFEAYLLEKTLSELSYHLRHRPAWMRIPLHRIQQMLETKTP